MKKTVFLGAVAMTLLAASCSQESDQPTRNDAITFGVTTNLASRAANAFCNTNLPGDFNFSAFFADGSAYISAATEPKVMAAHTPPRAISGPKMPSTSLPGKTAT